MLLPRSWSQNNGLQLQNLTIRTRRATVMPETIRRVAALRWRQSPINSVNILAARTPFFVTNSGVRRTSAPVKPIASRVRCAGDEQLC